MPKMVAWKGKLKSAKKPDVSTETVDKDTGEIEDRKTVIVRKMNELRTLKENNKMMIKALRQGALKLECEIDALLEEEKSNQTTLFPAGKYPEGKEQ